MISESRVLFLCFLLTSSAVLAQVPAAAPPFVPFEMLWNVNGPVEADASFLLQAPAGKHGFITVRDGHLYEGAAGPRLRIWGVNFSFVASLPPKDLAPAVAAHLARFGINCVRVHHHDWRAPRGIIDSRFADSRHLDPDAMDRLDFLVSELKKKGIYTDLNLNVARAFQPGDGVKDAEQLGFGKGVTIFDERIIELQKEFARQYLTHKNPYTGNEYRNEPAVAIVEILNENSLMENWVRGRLVGKGPDPAAADRTWTDLPASYAADLTRRYQTYLAQQVSASDRAKLEQEAGSKEIPRLVPDQFSAASDLRFRTEAAFYMDLETRFYDNMGAFLKKDLGVKAPIVGTSAHAGSLSPYPLLKSTSRLDVIDAHTYWQHPRYFMENGKRQFDIRNTPMLDEPGKSTVMTLGRVAVAGKPFIVSEVNHPYPSEYAAEMIPILAAYGAFQDWDGIFWYSFEHSDAANWKPKPPGYFDIRQDPVKMSQLVTGAMMFVRADVAPARTTVLRSYTPEQIADSLKLPAAEGPFFTSGFPPTLPLIHGTRMAAKADNRWPKIDGGKSDTGQLNWGKDSIVIQTPRSVALVGRLQRASGGGLTASTVAPYSAIMLSAMDGNPLNSTAKALLTVGGRTSNQGMTWNAKRTSTPQVGTAPVQIEVVNGTVAITALGKAKSVEVQMLDGAGRPCGETVAAKRSDHGWQIPLTSPSPWYLLKVTR